MSPAPRNLRRRQACGRLLVVGLPTQWLIGCATATPAAPTATAPYRLVDRLGWGANDRELARAATLGAAAYVEAQFAPAATATLPDAAQRQIDQLATLGQPLEDTLVALEAQRKAAEAEKAAGVEDARQAYQKTLNRHARDAATRHVLRALYSSQPLREQLTWFWFNHFNVHQYKGNLRAMLGDYEEHALRPQALGDFRAMLGAVTRHPAMLRYLDNEHNAVGRGNENHARELLELHTLGVDGGYTQRDVQELARVLTGHGVHAGERPRLKREHEPLYVKQGAYEFHPGRHDFGDKQILGRTIRGRGAEELDEVLDLLAEHPSTARHVCGRLTTFLAVDAPPPALVERMAAAFRSGHIEAALRVLLKDETFTAGPPKFKDPMHFVLSAVRAAYDERVILNAGPILGWLNRLGEGLYNRQTPDGYPLTADAWNGSGQLAVRFEVARAVGGGSSGLFKPEETSGAPEQAAFPQLARQAYYLQVRPGLRDSTRQALDNAASPQEWNALYLASPEFNQR